MEGDRTYLYTGFCGRGDKSRTGAMATVLGPDMLTIEEAPVFVAPGCEYSQGTGFEGHEFFEAPSIRKVGDTYYMIYSPKQGSRLAYATSDKPTGPYKYRGYIVDNGADYPAGNDHGSIMCIN